MKNFLKNSYVGNLLNHCEILWLQPEPEQKRVARVEENTNKYNYKQSKIILY